MLITISRLREHPAIGIFFSSISTLLIKTASAGLIYAMFVLTARAMTISEFGKFGVGFNLAAFLAIIASCGVHVGINRWWPEYIAKGEPPLAAASFSWGFNVTIVASVGLAIAAIAATAVSATFLQPTGFYIFSAIGLLVPLALADYLANALRAQGALWWAQIPKDIIWRLGGCAIAICAVARSSTLDASSALLMLSLSLSVLVAIQLIIAAQAARTASAQHHVPPAQIKRERANWLRITGPLWGGAVLNAVAQNVDVLLVGALISVDKSAEYFAAVRTVGLLTLMHVASTLVCAPIISRNVHSNKLKELQQTFRIVASLVGVATLFLLIALIILGPFLLSLFGPAFGRGYPLLLMLAFGFGFNALCGPVGYLLMLAGYEREYLKILCVSYALSIVIQCTTIPVIGAMGAAIGSTVALILSGAWARKVALQRIGIDPTAICILSKR